VGRLEEARNESRIVLAPPYASAYPEWRETREEIEARGRRPSRATVALSREASSVGDLLYLPVPERVGGSEEAVARPANQRARVLDLLSWKDGQR